MIISILKLARRFVQSKRERRATEATHKPRTDTDQFSREQRRAGEKAIGLSVLGLLPGTIVSHPGAARY